MLFKEENFENVVMDLLSSLGYTTLNGYDVERDQRNPLYMKDLIESLLKINPNVPLTIIEEAIKRMIKLEHGTLIQQNKRVIDWLQNGMEVTYYDKGENKTEIVKFIDYQHVKNNHFTAINQWKVIEKETKIPDIVVFVNGLPLVVIELKSISREEVDISDAYRQIKNYMHEIPTLFSYNAFCIIGNLMEVRAGSLTANESRFMEWKSIDGQYEDTRHVQYDVLFCGMLEHTRFLDIIENFICFATHIPEDVKILAAYHQYYAVNKAVQRAIKATKIDGKGGVFWHTQGSGKSLSMVFYAKLLQKYLDSPTIVVLTDRNDLDNQLYSQFSVCKDFLRQTPIQATDRKHLKKLLNDRQANGIFFSTMQKFEESEEILSDRRNIIVISDEAHRSQYGLSEKVKKDGTIVKGAARIIRDSLPNATYVGFTGTPISSNDRNTQEVFGGYIDVYDMTQAVLDGATRPVYYESRVINLGLDENILKQIDTKYEELALESNEYDIEKSKKELGNMEAILGADTTINALCEDIIKHYEETRAHLLTGKAMVVAYSRPIAMKIYDTILKLRPDWKEKIGVVMTSGNNDPEEWRDIIGNKTYKAKLANTFKNDDSAMKIAIVVDMWLTGFDVPSLSTMYVYKPMMGHNLMQAIARVNRVFQDKEGGLVVDYIGIASALKAAMKEFTIRDQQKYGDPDIAKIALPKFKEYLEICDDIFYGYDYTKFLNIAITDKERADLILNGINFILGLKESERKEFLKNAMGLKQIKSLCQSLLNEKERLQSAFFETIRVAITKVVNPEKISLKEINQQINHLLHQSIKNDGIINLFSDIEEEFSIFDEAFLDEIAHMKTKNLAAELLQKLLKEQITIYQHTNIVQSEKFSERMKQLMNSYRNRQLTNAEVIDEMKKLALEMKHAYALGNELGLSSDELAFYDALTKPKAVKDFYDNEQLKKMTQELTEQLRKNSTVDWHKKESARAQMRIMIKRLLKKYKYPPEKAEDAIDTVIKQCELWAKKTIK